MTIIDHGFFAQYIPEITDNFPEDDPLRQNRIIFCCNEKNVDWYSLQGWIEPGAALVEVDPETGRFIGATGEGGVHDYSTRWPLNKRLLEVRPAEAADGLTSDMRYWNGTFEPVPPPVPALINRRQFYTGLALQELISEDEALAALCDGRNIPTRLQTFIDGITDPAERFSTKMLLAGADIHRDHPLTAKVAHGIGWEAPAVDEFFRFAAAL